MFNMKGSEDKTGVKSNRRVATRRGGSLQSRSMTRRQVRSRPSKRGSWVVALPSAQMVACTHRPCDHRPHRSAVLRQPTVSGPRSNSRRQWLVVLLIALACLVGGCTGAVQETAAVPGSPSGPDSAQEVYEGVPVGFTADGYPYRGSPDAPITVEEYSDYLCPFCKRHFDQTMPGLIEQYVATGQASYVFRDLPLVGLHPTAPIGHAAALCVAEQGAARFWEMHDELFRAQNQWSQLPDPSDFLAGVAEAMGIDMAAYVACMASGRHDTRVEESVAAGQAFGFNGTPSFRFVDNESGETYTLVGAHPIDTFTQWLDALASGEAPAQAQEEEAEPAELPVWARAEGLAPDPDRPGFTMAGDPYKGNPEAVLVVVEYSDFQCPSCQRHALETHPVLDETFVDSGEIMWVFKHLPLKEHVRAPVASVAAECAADQGQFWEMYDHLFEALDEWSTDDDPDSVLLALAADLELDMDLFAACFNSRQALERVLGDLYDAQGVANVTPSFIVLYGGRGRFLTGARPADEFVATLQTWLDDAKSGESE